MTENKREYAKMRILFSHGIKLCAVLAVLLLIAAGCSSSGGETGTTPVPTGSDPAAIVLAVTPASIPAGGTATVTARVTDADGAIVVGATVAFSAESLYGAITATVDTDASGVATATFTSSGQTGTTTITATAGASVTAATTLVITPVATYLSLSTSKTSIVTDGVDAATITATVLNASRVPIEGLAVNFSVAAGQLSAANVITDANGQAATDFSSGSYEKTNQVVTVTAIVQDQIATIPIQVTGTTVTLALDAAQIAAGSATTLTITVKDGGGIAVFGAPVTITQSSGNGGTVTLSPESGETNVLGKLAVTVTGVSAGTITLTVSCLGVTTTTPVTVSGIPFEITSPTASSVSQATGTTLDITVRSPNNNPVTFITTLGTWSNNNTTITVPAPAGTVTETLTVGNAAGVASVRVEDATTPAINDSLQVAVYAAASTASKLTMQVITSSTIPPSSGGVTYSATIEASVKNDAESPVGDAPVTFALFKTVGGGEYVSPPIVYTGTDGVATTDFYSGSLVTVSTGVMCLGRIDGAAVAGPGNAFSFNLATSTITRTDGGSFVADGFVAGDAIEIVGSAKNDGGDYTVTAVAAATLTLDSLQDDEAAGASLVIATAQDTDVVEVLISGKGSSIAIGGATVISDYNDATYQYPMSVIINDSGGNPVENVIVTLSLWPVKYATGQTSEEDGPVRTGEFYNEDRNRNDNLDPGEDTNGPLFAATFPVYYDGIVGEGPLTTAANGKIDPQKSTAGTVPVTVITDEYGVAAFDHLYLKQYAGWLKVEYRATAEVYGSETVSTMTTWLGWEEGEKANIPNSPWGWLPHSLP